MNRREFLQTLALAAASGFALDPDASADGGAAPGYALDPLASDGRVTLMHFTDCHAQLLPLRLREPSINLGAGDQRGRPPHLVGTALLRHFGIAPGTRAAHALTHLDFVAASQRFGKVGGFAHLATLVELVRAARPGALLLDGGDSWQGSATALWTGARDMVEASILLGVDAMTGHWEFTLGAERLREIVDHELDGRIAFLAHNIRTADFGDPVFPGYTIRERNGVPIAIIGQAYPYTPIAHPRRFVPDWTFGIQEAALQATIDEVRGRGARVVVLLSHNGMDVDLKLAGRVGGLDAILGGHTHDAVPAPVVVGNRGGRTLVTNAGSNGKFLGVLDFETRNGAVTGYRYRLLPVFADLLPAHGPMAALIERVRAPFAGRLGETLAVSGDLLYRRGNFNGSFDQLILDGLIATCDAQIALSPGFRWGTSLVPGEAITMERLLEQTALTYPATHVAPLSGAQIKEMLEDACDNVFNPDPYYQLGGDMVRVGGLSYACEPGAATGQRISDLRLAGRPLSASKTYKVARWATVADNLPAGDGAPIWDLMASYLKAQKIVRPRHLDLPRLIGVAGDPGLA